MTFEANLNKRNAWIIDEKYMIAGSDKLHKITLRQYAADWPKVSKCGILTGFDYEQVSTALALVRFDAVDLCALCFPNGIDELKAAYNQIMESIRNE